MKQALLIFLFILITSVSPAQSISKADSLLKLLEKEETDTGKIVLSYRLAYELQFSDPEESEKIALKSLDEAKRIKFPKGIGNSLIQLGNLEQIKGNYQKAEEYNKEALEILIKAHEKEGVAVCYNNLGIIAHNSNDYSGALFFYKKSLEINLDIGRRSGEATALYCIGTVYENQAKYDSALRFYMDAQTISELISDKKLQAYGKLSIANVYFRMQNYTRSINYYLEAGEIYRTTGNNYGLLKAYTSIGQAASELDSLDLSIEYLNRAMNISSTLNSPGDIANIAIMLADLYEDAGITDSARVNYEKAIVLYKQTGSNENISLTMIALARLKSYEKDYPGAIAQLEDALKIAKEIASPSAVMSACQELSLACSAMNDFKKAFVYLNRYSELRDSLMTVEKQKQILELQTQYETVKKEKENELLKKDKEILQTTRNSLISGAFLLVIIIALVFRSLTIKKRDNRILKEQKEEINRQKEIVEIQKTSITDSIRYAKRIQSAMLPPEDILNQNLPDSFILYLPRDIVSGDFYLLREIDKSRIIFCVADCTGHGVPGAFMSMLGMSLINDIINLHEDRILTGEYTPADILNELRERIKKSLRQTGKEGEARDGMDISLCLFEKETHRLIYSGANNPIYIVHNEVLTELKATRNPIGIYIIEKSFTDQVIDVKPGSVIYMFSDGYSDQIGSGGSKFLSKNFKQLLANISNNPMENIKETLHKSHLDWRKEEEQVDDILVAGIRVS